MSQKFFICSVGETDSDYEDENLQRCIDNNGHFMHRNTRQKGVFWDVEAGDIALLKYHGMLIAYGEVEGRDTSESPLLKDWNYAVYVKQWIFFDKNDEKKGVSNYGVTWDTLSGAQFATIKEITSDYALKRMGEIDKNTDLYLSVKFKIAEEKNMKFYTDILSKNFNIILHGAPGTGKTYLAKKIAIEGLGCKQENIGFVQFHPSYDYTDFVEGLRPIEKEGKEIGFEKKDGVFVEFCKKAVENPAENFVFIIDEINRGEISKIFGELFYSIDPGYRLDIGKLKNGNEIEKTIRTQYANMQKTPNCFDIALNEKEQFGHFFIPKNVFIIGTMNDIDRSVDSMDFAFRRRFSFIEIFADDNVDMLNSLNDSKDEAIKRMKALNYKIWHKPIEGEDNTMLPIEGLSSSYHIGAAYFLKLKNYENDFEKLWKYNLEGLLKEYLRGMDDAEHKLEELKSFYDNPDRY